MGSSPHGGINDQHTQQLSRFRDGNFRDAANVGSSSTNVQYNKQLHSFNSRPEEAKGKFITYNHADANEHMSKYKGQNTDSNIHAAQNQSSGILPNVAKSINLQRITSQQDASKGQGQMLSDGNNKDNE